MISCRKMLVFVGLAVAVSLTALSAFAEGALVNRLTFDDTSNLLKATVGADGLAYDNPAAQQTGLGKLTLCTDAAATAGLAYDSSAIVVPQNSFLSLTHGIETSGTKPYCLALRCWFQQRGTGNYGCLYSLDQNNAGDGYCFINSSNLLGGGTGGWSGYAGSLSMQTWHTVVISVEDGKATPYIDNLATPARSASSTVQHLNGRPKLHLFCDNSSEDGTFYVDEVRVYDVARPDEIFTARTYTVAGEPQIGEPSPGYGEQSFSGLAPVTLTAPGPTVVEGVAYVATGWRLERAGSVFKTGTDLTVAISAGDLDGATFTWLFKPQLSLTVTGSPEECGDDVGYGLTGREQGEVISQSAFTGVWTNSMGTKAATCIGYEIWTNDSSSVEHLMASGPETSVSFTMPNAATRLTWKFDVTILVPGITLDAGDAAGEHSFDTAGHWSSEAAPTAGDDYLVALGTAAYLRTPVSNITAEASATYTTFAGDKLTIGTPKTPGVLYDLCTRYARLKIDELHLVNGMILNGTDQNFYQPAHEQALYGTFYVHSTTNNPFTFKTLSPKTSGYDSGGLSLRGPLVGDADAAIRVTSGLGAPLGVDTYLALYVDNPDYKGRFIVEGNGRLWPGHGRTVTDTTFGAVPATFVKDAIILRNGGGFGSSSSTAWNFKAPNRGIWVEGWANFGSQGSYTISMPIGGGKLADGKYVSVSPHIYSVITIDAPVTVYPLKIGGGRVLFGPNATIDDTEPVVVSSYIGTSVDRSVKLNFQGTGFYYPTASDRSTFPVLTLKEGSVWKDGLNTCTIRISDYGFPMARQDGWISCLKVPTSVKDLSEVTFSCLTANGTMSGANFKVETVNGIQTLYVQPPTYYVVHPDNRPAGHEPVAPYTSWATAATNIIDAVTNATSALGGQVYIDRGTYDIRTPIPMPYRYLKDGGWIYPAISLIGVDRTTMKHDAEHVILDGGYPARTNMLFSFSGSLGSSLVSLTMQHGCNMSTDPGFNGGGVGVLRNAASDFIVTGCRFIENYANYGGVFNASIQTLTNCYFKGNVAFMNASCFCNGQGGASVNGNYLNVRDCVFEDNGNTTGSGQLYSGRSARFYNCTFRRCGRGGAGLFGSSYYSTIQNCTFVECGGSASFGCSGDSPYVASDIVVSNCNVGTGTALSIPGFAAGAERLTVINTTCGYAISCNYGNIRNFAIISNNCATAPLVIGDGSTTSKPYVWDSGTIASNVTAYAVRLSSNDGNIINTNVIQNCVFWGNRTAKGEIPANNIYLKNKRWINFTHCDAEMGLGVYGDDTCFSTDPRFVNPAKGDFRLKPGSKCREKAVKADWMTGATDLDGNPRVLDKAGKPSEGALPDIGCYECAIPMPGMLLLIR